MKAYVKKEVGSELSLNFRQFFKKPVDNFSSSFSKSKKIFLASGRDCFDYIVKALDLGKKDIVLFPSYLCGDIFPVFDSLGIKTAFYKVKANLDVDMQDLSKKAIALNPKLIDVIHYFGFPQPKIKKIKKICEKIKALLVEDCAQSLLSNGCMENGDFIITSFRKFIPVPDGAFLSIQSKDIREIKTFHSFTHFKIVLKRLFALLWKGLYLKHPSFFKKSIFRKQFMWAEKKLSDYKKPVCMARISKRIMRTLDFLKIIKQRRKNYSYLLKNLPCKALYPNLSPGICPLGLPIILKNKNRDKIKQHLAENGVYTPVHWVLDKRIDKKEYSTAWNISKNILTLPIQHVYAEDDMNYVLKNLKSALKK